MHQRGTMAISSIRISTTSFAASPNCNSGNCLNQSSNNIDSTTRTLSTATGVACGNLVNFAGSGAGSVSFYTSVSHTNTQIINGSEIATGFATSAVVLGSTP